eukprot:Rhum_TRINITY_DN10777_c0_g1::Rhum_TRINITY_DN10777_c0_g1_i1::g.40153::m.40153
MKSRSDLSSVTHGEATPPSTNTNVTFVSADLYADFDAQMPAVHTSWHSFDSMSPRVRPCNATQKWHRPRFGTARMPSCSSAVGFSRTGLPSFVSAVASEAYAERGSAGVARAASPSAVWTHAEDCSATGPRDTRTTSTPAVPLTARTTSRISFVKSSCTPNSQKLRRHRAACSLSSSVVAGYGRSSGESSCSTANTSDSAHSPSKPPCGDSARSMHADTVANTSSARHPSPPRRSSTKRRMPASVRGGAPSAEKCARISAASMRRKPTSAPSCDSSSSSTSGILKGESAHTAASRHRDSSSSLWCARATKKKIMSAAPVEAAAGAIAICWCATRSMKYRYCSFY